MNIKSQKGITGIDISIAVIIILLFMGLIATLIYNYTQNSSEVKRKSNATYIIIDVLEYAKNLNYSELNEENINNYQKNKFLNDKKYEGYLVETKVEDCSEIFGENSEDVFKKVTVTVKYQVKKNENKLQIYTIIKNTNYIQDEEEKSIPVWSVDD